jgi:UDP-N-acetyl-D-mannosaminuronic acid dehydrogenase
VLPGKIIREVVENDRIVGGVDEESSEAARAFYETFVGGQIFCSTARVAETAKLAENAFRDVNIAFANELSLIAESLDLDIWELIRFANRHPRVNILRPGPGVGGHCIAVDPWFLIQSAPDAAQLTRAARAVNERKPREVIARIQRHAQRLRDPVIACLGLTYKPDVDDLRESPALQIARELRADPNISVRTVEPNIQALDGWELSDLNDAVRDADIIVILVAHRSFRSLSRRLLAEKFVVDTCGALEEA